MKSKRLFLILTITASLAAYGCGQRQVREGKGYHTLGNGMRVILVENHASPMIASIVLVNAGSIYEDDSNNGVSHLLEHLLFDGTRERTRIEIMEGIEDHGGYLNATTRDDHTAYILLIPSESADYGLEVQADMLFHSIFPDSELAKERKVVMEEINKDTDRPSNLSEKFHRAYLYQGTPFSRPVIGYKNIIASLPKEEIVGYYRQRYVPQNMVAFVAGDFQSDRMLADLERIFGSIPPGKTPQVIDRVNLPRRTNRVYRLNNPSKVSYVNISFDAPAAGDGDYYAYDYFVRTLSYHEAAPLLSALKGGEKPIALSVTSDLSPHRGFSTFTVSMTTGPGNEDKAIQKVLDVLKEESSREPTQDEMKSVMVDIKSSEYFLRERYHYYGLMKAPYLLAAGFDFLDTYIPRMEDVTSSTVQKVAEKYFARPRYIATVVGPSSRVEPSVSSATGRGEVTSRVLGNGLRLIIKEEGGSDIFAVHVIVPNRAYLEPEGKTGVADFLSRMLMRGTKTKDREALSADLARIGANVTVVENPYIPYDDYYATRKFSFIRFEALREYWREGLSILADIIRNPAMDPQEVEGVRQEMLGLIAQRDESTYKTARKIFYRTLFAGHPFSRPIMGEKDDVSQITASDLKWLHQSLYAPNNLIFGVTGGVPTDSVIGEFNELFSDMKPVELPGNIPPAPVRHRHLQSVEKRMGKEQAYIYMGGLLPGITDDDVPALRVMIAILSDWLGKDLREKEGLAYSVGASAQFARGFGWYTITMGTEKGNYQRALGGIRREIDRMRSEAIDKEVISKAVNRTRGRVMMQRLSSINRAYFLSLYDFLYGDYDKGNEALDALKSVKPADVHRVAQRYLHADRGVLASVR